MNLSLKFGVNFSLHEKLYVIIYMRLILLRVKNSEDIFGVESEDVPGILFVKC